MIKLRFRSLKGRCTSLNEVFFIIRAEEGRSVMLDTPITEGSALVTMKPNSTLPNNNYGISEVSRLPINKNGLWCVYCKKPRHTCWKFYGKPQSFGRGNGNLYAQFGQRNGQAHIAQSKREFPTKNLSF